MKPILLLLFASPFIFSCQSPVPPQEKQLLNVNALLNKSFEHYRKHPPVQMSKTLIFGEVQGKALVDTTEFGNIDTLFRGVSIIKSAYLNSYYISDKLVKDQATEGIHHLSYRIKEKENALVKRLDYFYRDSGMQKIPIALLILKKDFNKLYKSSQIIRVSFQGGWLESLQITGSQDILFRKPTSYLLRYNF